MAKKIFMAAVVSLILCAGVKAEAADVYVGMSPATGYECYVMTNTISYKNEHRMFISSATLKMVDQYGGVQYLDYTFFDLDNDAADVDFTNSQGFSGKATPQDTPIEWAMYTVMRERIIGEY
ncbi:MAG: hypothetical protein IJG33_14000 [Selenomonadaceae bacterium]|nr:hypothetical protein [Selenomonadaceae bacterium]